MKFYQNSNDRWIPLKVAGIFLVASGIWIIASDKVLMGLAPNQEVLATLQTYKGLLYTVVMGVLIYVSMSYLLKRDRQVRNALQAKEFEYREIFNATSEALLIHDPVDGAILDANEATGRMYGYPLEVLSGLTIGDVSAGEPRFTQEDALKWIRKAVDEGPQVFDWLGKKKSGELVWEEVTLRSTEIGGKECVLAVIRDITKRRKVEESLKKSEEKYRTFFENSTDPILMIRNGVFVDCNTAVVKALGYTDVNEILNLHPSEISPEYQPDGKKSSEKELEMMETTTLLGSSRFEWEHVGKNGESVPVEVSMTALKSEGEKAFLGIWRDISDRKKAEEERVKLEDQLRQSQKMEAIGQLAGGVAHDFNNILHAIMGYGEIALLETEPDNPIREDLDEVLKASKRAAGLVQQLLAFSRKQVLKLETLDLNEVVEEFAKMIRRLIGEHISLNMHSEPGKKMIHADRGQIGQILMNLCVNARDAMPDGGKLTIETEYIVFDTEFCRNHPWAKPGNYSLLTVSDTGCGINKEVQQHIFEPFYTTKAEGEGTGLGLSTVYGIVRQHSGMIQVYSEVGVGTNFKIYLPLSEKSATDIVNSIQESPPGGTETILLAEDDEKVLNLVVRILKNAGYTLLTAKDGEEAIRMFDSHKEEVNLAILDVVMPKCNGREVFNHIRENGGQTPVLFASGYSSGGIHTNFVLEEGMEFIQKPYQRIELLKEVRRLLDT